MHFLTSVQNTRIVCNIECNTNNKCLSSLLYETTLKITVKKTSANRYAKCFPFALPYLQSAFLYAFCEAHLLSFALHFFLASGRDLKIRREKSEVGYYFPNPIHAISLGISKFTEPTALVGRFST